MKKFIFRHKIIFIALALSLLLTFFFVPFIEVPPPPGTVNPCPYGDPQLFKKYCNMDSTTTIFAYLTNPVPIDVVNWRLLLASVIGLFILIYIDLWLLLYVIKPQKAKNSMSVIIKKTLIIAAMLIIPLTIILIIAFFGNPFWGM